MEVGKCEGDPDQYGGEWKDPCGVKLPASVDTDLDSEMVNGEPEEPMAASNMTQEEVAELQAAYIQAIELVEQLQSQEQLQAVELQ